MMENAKLLRLVRRDVAHQTTPEEATYLRSAELCGAWRDGLVKILSEGLDQRTSVEAQYVATERRLLSNGDFAAFETFKQNHAVAVSRVVQTMAAAQRHLKEANNLCNRQRLTQAAVQIAAPSTTATASVPLSPKPKSATVQLPREKYETLKAEVGVAHAQIADLRNKLAAAGGPRAAKDVTRYVEQYQQQRQWGIVWRERAKTLAAACRIALQVETQRGVYADPVVLEILHQAIGAGAGLGATEWPPVQPLPSLTTNVA